MKIMVISDTHGKTGGIEKIIRSEIELGLIIHLGDYTRDAVRLSKLFPEIPVEFVHGNCDFQTDGISAEKILEIEGKRLFITHGHSYSVKWGYQKLYYRAEEVVADILLFGHTHTPELFDAGNCIFINPGSASEPRNGSYKSYAVIEMKDGAVKPKLCPF